MKAIPTADAEFSRTVDMYTATKSNQKEVFSLKQGETFVKAKTEGPHQSSRKSGIRIHGPLHD